MGAASSGDLQCPSCGRKLVAPTLLVDGKEGVLDSVAADASSSTNASEDLIGREIAGCRIDARIGQGACGCVYKGHHRALDIPVAVKTLLPRLAMAKRNYVDRFVREARASAKVQHQNIVGVLDVGEENGTYFIVMQYVDGENLEQKVETGGLLPVDEVISVGLQMCDALEAARRHSIVHRDIKPSNIMIDRDGIAKLTDLGLAKSADADSGTTAAGSSLGTPQFMAPEQVLDATTADHRSDLYSLGCSLYYAVCGRPPYEGSSVFEVMAKHVNEPVPDPREERQNIPADLAQVIRRLMAKNPVQRYATAKKVAEALRAARSKGAASDEAEAGAPKDLEGARVLVVDDLRPMRFFFTSTLSKANANVSEAHNGALALQALKEASRQGEPFNLLVTDIYMPAMDGLELLRRVRSDPELRETPVIVISTEEDQSVLLEFARLGISSYLVKPPRGRQVLEVARQALDTSEAWRASRISAAAAGLSLPDVKELYRTVTDDMETEVAQPACPMNAIFESPVYVRFIEFLQRHCPRALQN
jgi:CheY-like chemotaxis protein